MDRHRLLSWCLGLCLGLTFLVGAPVGALAQDRSSLTKPIHVTSTTPKAVCLNCHGVSGFAVPLGKTGEGPKRQLYVNPKILTKSIHGKEKCVACHQDIKQIPHKTKVKRTVDCQQCHKTELKHEEWAAKHDLQHHKKQPFHQKLQALLKVQQNTTQYLTSIHAQKKAGPDSQVNANCWDCHGTHNVFPASNKKSTVYRLNIPKTCGRCHTKQLKAYSNSVHGTLTQRYGKTDAAVCSDCHTTHSISLPKLDPVKLLIVDKCGTCHKDEYKTYRKTYHGQVERLGYTFTAKCYDCHAHHDIQRVDNPTSKVALANRVNTCKQCHKNATAGFATFEPHGNTDDFDRFPEMWITSKIMIVLLGGVFLFFWTHSALWFYREHKERKTGKAQIRIDGNGDPIKKRYVKRYSWQWRLVHLILAVTVMVLVLTGTTLLYSNSFWAPFVVKIIGGAKAERIIHRTFATIFGILFVGNLIFVLYNGLIKNRKTFRWFGPDSLIPRWKDLADFLNMVKWFFGKGPRPCFDRWTYWEKFDYWAPFWGMFIIGTSGLTLWFHDFVANYLPGWIFNVATILHGEEAFLAAVFLFTVHFFNCHFRPDKFPQDTLMFTGRMTLEEFKKDHSMQYERFVKEGTLEQYLVGAPSPAMAKYSKVLGGVLIAIGLTLLTLVLIGFLS